MDNIRSTCQSSSFDIDGSWVHLDRGALIMGMGAYHHPDQQLVACWHMLLGMGPQWNL